MPTNYLSQINVNDENYKIKDSELRQQLSSLSASSISYDSSSSSLTADDVQEAIDSILISLQPDLTVTAPTGSSLIITNGTTTITGVAENGVFSTKIPELGTWTVTASLNSKTTTDTISITEVGQSYDIVLEFFSAELQVNALPGAEVYVDGKSRGFVPEDDSYYLSIQIIRSGTHLVQAKYNNFYSEEKTVTFSTEGEVSSIDIYFREIGIESLSGVTYILTDGNTTYTNPDSIFPNGEMQEAVFLVPNDGVWTITLNLDGKTRSDSCVVNGFNYYHISLDFTPIYGAEWDGSSSTVLSRTDDSALFVDPDPYVADGNHPGSSPFDNLMPWSGMMKETINGNVLVKIPKFWYKITTSGSSIKFQIADKAINGFNVSPAHQDRGDGVGERDYIYVGRYHSTSNYKSQGGSEPLTDITRATGRTNIKKLGTGFYLWDYATLVTIWLLYIVEFANWDSQTCIGYGCSSDSAKYTTSATSSMPYHTGTTATSRTSYTNGCQYRYIEDLWGNVLDWCDGIRFDSSNIYIYKNPSDFSDTYGGVNTGTRPTTIGGEISSWGQPSTIGYDWAIYPSAITGVTGGIGSKTYVSDRCYYDSSGVTLSVGGSYSKNLFPGLFYLSGSDPASYSSGSVGIRVMYLPTT